MMNAVMRCHILLVAIRIMHTVNTAIIAAALC